MRQSPKSVGVDLDEEAYFSPFGGAVPSPLLLNVTLRVKLNPVGIWNQVDK